MVSKALTGANIKNQCVPESEKQESRAMTIDTQTYSHPEPMDHDTNLLSASIRALALPAVICAAGMAFFAALPANAQSFSCETADQTAEFAICNDENLLLLDEKLGEIFARKYVNASTSPQRQAVTREQTSWLQKRNACGDDFTCLTLRYRERIRELQSRAS